MILGNLMFLFALGILSYFLKGYWGIRIIFCFYFSFCLFIFFKFLKSKIAINQYLSFRKTLPNAIIAIILVIYLSLLFIYASGFQVGADADIYWGIATSFTRGNYPTVLPWQPEYLTVYHEGAFIIEGALRALAPVGIAAIHNFFSYFVLSAILIFTVGLMREKTRSVFCLLPAILGISLFGGPVLLIKGFPEFIKTVLNLPNIVGNLSQFPGYEYFRGGNGAGASDVLGLMYNNFYTFGLAAFLFFGYVFYLQSKIAFNLRNYLILIILSVVTCSIDESFFLLQGILLLFLYFFQVRNQNINKIFFSSLTLFFVFLISFFIIQNPLRDSLLTPSSQIPRFKLLIESNESLFKKYTFRQGEHILWNGKDTGVTANETVKGTLDYVGENSIKVGTTDWYILDLKVILVISLVIALLIHSRLSLLFFTSSFLSLLLSLFILNSFWPPNHLRLANQASQLFMFGLGILLVDLVGGKKKKIFYLIFFICLLTLTPQFFISQAKLLKLTFNEKHSVFNDNLIDSRLAEIEAIVPGLSKIIFLDDYPANSPSTYLNSSALSRYGLFVPMSPPQPKVLDLEKGMEWYDGVNTLAPYAFEVLNIDYIYVNRSALNRLSSQKISYLNNPDFFQKIKQWDGASLYKVRSSFKNQSDNDLSIKKIISIIGSGRKIYLDKFYLNELRRIFLLQLSKQNYLIGPPHAHGGDFFMYIETEIPFKDACNIYPCNTEELKSIRGIQYALMKPEDNPNILLNGNFEKIASINYVDLWQNTQNEQN